ncbi:MAG: response regulator transcription factor [Syntrophaceae bacterium]|nr:response regulator transcription factor [Syntrophaceae bacterium]
MSIKVMVVDDHDVVREGLRQILEISDDVKVIGEARNGLECLEQLDRLSPDIIFMDIQMPGISGIETTRLARKKKPGVRVIILTIYQDAEFVTEAIQAGAIGYVLKTVGKDELHKIIRHVMDNHAFIDPLVTSSVIDEIKRDGKVVEKAEKPVFTKRELEVMSGLVAGQKDRDIAESLNISAHTVRSHIKNIFQKLGVSTKPQAVAAIMREKIITG